MHIKTYLLQCSSRGRVSIIWPLLLQGYEYAYFAVKLKEGNLILCLKINVQTSQLKHINALGK